MKTLRLKALAAVLAACLATPALAADPVLEWNSIMVATTATQNPFAQARFAAITQLAVFEAMNAIRQDYDPYLGTVSAPHWASTHAAAIAAAHGVLKTYFPANSAMLDAARESSVAAIADGAAKTAGLAAGEAAAAALVAHRNGDGSAPPAFHVPSSTAVGEWQTTPGCPPSGGILAHWGKLQPFAIEAMDQFRSPRPPAITSRRYTKDYEEVKRVGGVNSTHRPQDRADVARFYAAALAVPVWNSAATQVAIAHGHSAYENARALALLNAAISDALASVMETKYVYRFWRPETAIRAGDADGNPRTHGDTTFAPFIVTPCFPTYVSAHASAAGAAREILERLYGPRRHAITITTPSLPELILQYRSFEQIADDIDDARVFGGIHFRFDQEAGAQQGRKIGAYVHRNLLRRSFWWCDFQLHCRGGSRLHQNDFLM